MSKIRAHFAVPCQNCPVIIEAGEAVIFHKTGVAHEECPK